MIRSISRVNYLNAYAWTLLLVLINLYFVDSGIIKIVGGAFIVLIICFSLIKIVAERKIFIDLFLPITVFVTCLIISTNQFNVDALYKIIVMLTMLLFVSSFMRNKLYPDFQEIIINMLSAFFVVFTILIFILNQGGRLEDLGVNMVMLKSLFAISFFFLLKQKRMLVAILIVSILFILVGERASALAVLFIYIFYCILGRVRKKLYYNLVYILTAIICVCFPFLYVELKYSELGASLQLLSMRYTSSNFFSGRENIWEAIIVENKHSVWFGLGSDYKLSALLDTTLSTHNLYMYLYMAGGGVALICFFSFMYCLWRKYRKHIDDKLVRLSAAYFLGILIFCSFELVLLLNNIVGSISFWFVIGLGIMRVHFLEDNNCLIVK